MVFCFKVKHAQAEIKTEMEGRRLRATASALIRILCKKLKLEKSELPCGTQYGSSRLGNILYMKLCRGESYLQLYQERSMLHSYVSFDSAVVV